MTEKRDEFFKDAEYLRGASDALRAVNEGFADRLAIVADKLDEAANHICAQGYYGCRGGSRCDSDHK